MVTIDDLTEEQKEVLHQVSAGRNVLVDACIGSGKTTVIQLLCSQYPDRRILYLTYNKLLKADAIEKIKNKNTKVTNYHGFAYQALKKIGIETAVSELIRTFCQYQPECEKYQLMVIDEYQDISSDIAEMLRIIKRQNPDIQIVAVGDMWQKIYSNTRLDILDFMDDFLEDYKLLRFTTCFRICHELANRLSKVWKKPINGVNQECEVLEMTEEEAISFLSAQNPKDVLCIGRLPTVLEEPTPLTICLNELETKFPEKYNKYTTYATIHTDNPSMAVAPNKNTAIFTNYDKCKGLEKSICVIYDYTEEHWLKRTNYNVKYEIIRNLFCVAASRGKRKIIFVKKQGQKPLSMETLCERTFVTLNSNYSLDSMFNYKYSEDIERCWQMLSIEQIKNNDDNFLSVLDHDALIDLTPCISIYQRLFFHNYDINAQIADMNYYSKNYSLYSTQNAISPLTKEEKQNEMKVQKKILLITAKNTGQLRYVYQTKAPFVSEESKKILFKNLSNVFKGTEETQTPYCTEIHYKNSNENNSVSCINIFGRIDIRRYNTNYNLFYTDELSHEQFLITAFCMILSGSTIGIIWNTKKNKMYRIEIPDTEQFFMTVISTITKGEVTENQIQKIIIQQKERR